MGVTIIGPAGITKLSQLIIDANKDWNAKTITNLGGLGMSGNIDLNGNDIVDVVDLHVRDIYHPTGCTIDIFDDVNMNSNIIVNLGGLGMSGNIDLNNNFISECGYLSMNDSTSNIDMNFADIGNVDDLYVQDIQHPAGGLIDVFDDFDMNGNEVAWTGVIHPVSDDLVQCGLPGLRWNNIYTKWIVVNDISPPSDRAGDIGSSSYRFDDIWCFDLHEGDHVFAEKSCPLCNKKFKEGEGIINYVLSNTEEGTRTIPAHLTCAMKPKNQTKERHGEVIQKLKEAGRYIDPIKKMTEKKEKEKARELQEVKIKEMEIKLKAKRDAKLKAEEVKMQKITLEDGKKALLVSQGSAVKVYSEEQLSKQKERLTKELTEIQKFLDELNKK